MTLDDDLTMDMFFKAVEKARELLYGIPRNEGMLAGREVAAMHDLMRVARLTAGASLFLDYALDDEG
ncbi:MAG: hypothetical protein FWD75_03305 [Propionibacteriaceae bacterium]|nr:hypothetical protein [Propionibacteriaceae bacterium]